ncbi:MAG: glycosyltransferase [Deltaproteobacteria bacterium]|nr:glycosyltransferase [Deltaproteobacteria bacterium]
MPLLIRYCATIRVLITLKLVGAILNSESIKTIILTAYPLSSDFTKEINSLFSQGAKIVTIAQLRANGIRGLISQIWQIQNKEIILPIEDSNSSALLPLLKIVAGFTRAEKIMIVFPDLKVQAVSRWSILGEFVRFVMASASALVNAINANSELNFLIAKPRVSPQKIDVNGTVLYLKTNLWFGIKAGGSVGHIAGVINGLKRLGHQVIIASAEPPTMVDEEVHVVRISPPSAFGIPYELNNFSFQNSFERTLSDEPSLRQTGFIYQRLSAFNYLGAAISYKYGIPLVVEYNGSEVWVAKNWGRGLRFQKLAEKGEQALLKHAHLVVTISDVLRNELIERGVEPSRIVSYPNCIDPRIFSTTRFSQSDRIQKRRQYGISEDAKVVTFVGTFGQWHGTEVFADAINVFIREKKHWLDENKVHFMLVGDGLRMPLIREKLADAEAIGYCTFTGLIPQEQAAMHLYISDILVSPHVANADGSRFFGSPTKLFEYMAMARGIVASRLEQLEDVLSPALDAKSLPTQLPEKNSQETAVLFEPGNVQQLKQAIEFLVEREEWRIRLGENASKLAQSKYTWLQHVNAIKLGLMNIPVIR